jgi:hypothetical protein
MKAITIPQPWATFVALGLKQFHTVNFKTDYRGPISILASPDRSDSNKEAARSAQFDKLLKEHDLTFGTLPFGVIVAKAKLTAVHHSGFRIRTVSQLERKLNNPHWTHQYMLEFEDVVPVKDGQALVSGGTEIWEYGAAHDKEVAHEKEAAEKEDAPEKPRRKEQQEQAP